MDTVTPKVRDESYYLETRIGRLELKLYDLKLFFKYRLPHNIAWWLAFRLPRHVALMALVRIASGTLEGDEHPDKHGYSTMYRRFDAGKGR